MLDKFGRWATVAIVVAVLAYAGPVAQELSSHPYLAPGMRNVVIRALTLAAVIACMGGAAAAPVRYIPTLAAGDAIPTTLMLTTQNGRRFELSTFAGRAVLISFIYTRCRDARMCPLVAAKFATMQQSIGNEPIRLLLVTLDPAYDTPAVLASYGRRLGRSRKLDAGYRSASHNRRTYNAFRHRHRP